MSSSVVSKGSSGTDVSFEDELETFVLSGDVEEPMTSSFKNDSGLPVATTIGEPTPRSSDSFYHSRVISNHGNFSTASNATEQPSNPSNLMSLQNTSPDKDSENKEKRSRSFCGFLLCCRCCALLTIVGLSVGAGILIGRSMPHEPDCPGGVSARVPTVVVEGKPNLEGMEAPTNDPSPSTQEQTPCTEAGLSGLTSESASAKKSFVGMQASTGLKKKFDAAGRCGCPGCRACGHSDTIPPHYEEDESGLLPGGNNQPCYFVDPTTGVHFDRLGKCGCAGCRACGHMDTIMPLPAEASPVRPVPCQIDNGPPSWGFPSYPPAAGDDDYPPFYTSAPSWGYPYPPVGDDDYYYPGMGNNLYPTPAPTKPLPNDNIVLPLPLPGTSPFPTPAPTKPIFPNDNTVLPLPPPDTTAPSRDSPGGFVPLPDNTTPDGSMGCGMTSSRQANNGPRPHQTQETALDLGTYGGSATCRLDYVSCEPVDWVGFGSYQGEGVGTHWFKARAGENSICESDVEHRVHLSVPEGVDYDLHIYSNITTTATLSSHSDTTGKDELLIVSSKDVPMVDSLECFDYYILVEYRSGDPCKGWTLEVFGHDCLPN